MTAQNLREEHQLLIERRLVQQLLQSATHLKYKKRLSAPAITETGHDFIYSITIVVFKVVPPVRSWWHYLSYLVQLPRIWGSS